MKWAALTALLLALPSTAHAQTAKGPGWAFGSPAGEVGLGVFSFLSMSTFLLPQRESDWGPLTPRPRDEVAGRVSDFSGAIIGTGWQITSGFAFETAYYQQAGAPEPELRALRSSIIDTEAATLALGITGLLKKTTGRCRPRAWRDGHCAGGEYNSFPSGHEAPIAAVAASQFLRAVRSGDGSGLRYAPFAIAEGGAVLTGVLRVLAGAHGWDDVLAGWAVGSATGALVALMHPMEPVTTDGTGSTSQAFVTWSGAF